MSVHREHTTEVKSRNSCVSGNQNDHWYCMECFSLPFSQEANALFNLEDLVKNKFNISNKNPFCSNNDYCNQTDHVTLIVII